MIDQSSRIFEAVQVAASVAIVCASLLPLWVEHRRTNKIRMKIPLGLKVARGGTDYQAMSSQLSVPRSVRLAIPLRWVFAGLMLSGGALTYWESLSANALARSTEFELAEWQLSLVRRVVRDKGEALRSHIKAAGAVNPDGSTEIAEVTSAVTLRDDGFRRVTRFFGKSRKDRAVVLWPTIAPHESRRESLEVSCISGTRGKELLTGTSAAMNMLPADAIDAYVGDRQVVEITVPISCVDPRSRTFLLEISDSAQLAKGAPRPSVIGLDPAWFGGTLEHVTFCVQSQLGAVNMVLPSVEQRSRSSIQIQEKLRHDATTSQVPSCMGSPPVSWGAKSVVVTRPHQWVFLLFEEERPLTERESIVDAASSTPTIN